MHTTMTDINIIASLLKRRGFIFEHMDRDVFRLIRAAGCFGYDTYFCQDVDYLTELLREANAGETEGRGLFRLFEHADLAYLSNLFICTDKQVGVGAGGEFQSWDKIQNSQGFEFPVKWLDPYVAYYVKVMGMCGVKTSSCCDGNHLKENRKRLHISFEQPIYPSFHRWMWETLNVPCELRWNWNEKGVSARITENNKKEIYDKLFEAAQFFYEKRDLLISIRQEAARRIDNSVASMMNSTELSEKFIHEVNDVYSHIVS